MLSRRSFLAETVAGSAAVSALVTAGAEPRRIKAGFLGGSHSHAAEKWRLVSASRDYELVGMSEESAEVRAQYEKQGARFLNGAELIAASEVIFVESAVRDHGRDALQVLAAGKHVHIEKPAADNLKDVEEIIRLARAKNLIVQVGYMWRYHPGFAKIFELVRNGWLGDVYLARGMIGNVLAADRRPEWAEFKGGGLFELGSHLVDALIRLLGEPVSVTPFLRRDGSFDDNLKDNNLAVFQFPKALGLILNSNLQHNSGRRRLFEVFGTNGSAILNPIEPPALEVDLARAAGPYKAGVQTIPLPKYSRYAADLDDMAACIRGERKLPVTLEEELRVQKWLLKACEMI
ncbi:MAG TPA: Gfo/Idh/MocA family oxidoreductase [Verrucomicrobiae bacterium]|nr:Gfo/Idh/MocA family oxidoreductase [Verrucomicrobiae bacterium]